MHSVGVRPIQSISCDVDLMSDVCLAHSAKLCLWEGCRLLVEEVVTKLPESENKKKVWHTFLYVYNQHIPQLQPSYY